jgi:hypothetical protein
LRIAVPYSYFENVTDVRFQQYASGEVSSIAVWDLNSEMLAFDIPSQSDSTVTSLVSLSEIRTVYIPSVCYLFIHLNCSQRLKVYTIM